MIGLNKKGRTEFTSTTQYNEEGKEILDKYDNHYNDNLLNRILHPIKSKEQDYTVYYEYNEDGSYVASKDYDSDGTIDEIRTSKDLFWQPKQ